MTKKETFSGEKILMIVFLLIVGIVNFSLAVAAFTYWDKKELKKLMTVYIATLATTIGFMIAASAIAWKLNKKSFLFIAVFSIVIVGFTGIVINRLQSIKNKTIDNPEVSGILSKMKLNHYGAMSFVMLLGMECAYQGIAMIVRHIQKNKSEEMA